MHDMICDYYHVFMIPVSPILASGRTTGLIILYVNSSARLKTHNIIFLLILHMSRDKLLLCHLFWKCLLVLWQFKTLPKHYHKQAFISPSSFHPNLGGLSAMIFIDRLFKGILLTKLLSVTSKGSQCLIKQNTFVIILSSNKE